MNFLNFVQWKNSCTSPFFALKLIYAINIFILWILICLHEILIGYSSGLQLFLHKFDCSTNGEFCRVWQAIKFTVIKPLNWWENLIDFHKAYHNYFILYVTWSTSTVFNHEIFFLEFSFSRATLRKEGTVSKCAWALYSNCKAHTQRVSIAQVFAQIYPLQRVFAFTRVFLDILERDIWDLLDFW